MKRKFCYKDKSTGRKVCVRRYRIKPDKTPYVQDVDTGLMLGRYKKT